MRIVITGASGLLGKELTQHFRSIPGNDVQALVHQDLDVADAGAVRRVIGGLAPNIIINCAVIVSVDRCELDPKLASAVNRDGARNLLEAATTLVTPPVFVQISSSEVFGGWEEGTFKEHGYVEEDARDPRSVYQKTKAEAEDIISGFGREQAAKLRRWYIVRASWLFGDGRKTFVEQFLGSVCKREPITIAADQWRSPTWTRDFAEHLGTLIASDTPSGTYHIANEVAPGEATVRDVLGIICEHCRISLESLELNTASIRDFFKVPRAPSNVLLNTKLPKLRPWREALREYLKTRYPNPCGMKK